jgi:hypothetical protein
MANEYMCGFSVFFTGSNSRADWKCSVWPLWTKSQLHNGCVWAKEHRTSKGESQMNWAQREKKDLFS